MYGANPVIFTHSPFGEMFGSQIFKLCRTHQKFKRILSENSVMHINHLVMCVSEKLKSVIHRKDHRSQNTEKNKTHSFIENKK